MKDLTPKVDSTAGPTGALAADEFNDMRDDAQNAVTLTGQTLTVAVGDDNRQLLKAIAVGGERVTRTDTQTAQVGEIVLPDNSGGAITINLPAIANVFVNATVVFEQIEDELYSVNSLTVGRNSQEIMGDASDFLLDSVNADNSIIVFIWKAGAVGWSVNRIGQVGAGVVP